MLPCLFKKQEEEEERISGGSCGSSTTDYASQDITSPRWYLSSTHKNTEHYGSQVKSNQVGYIAISAIYTVYSGMKQGFTMDPCGTGYCT